MQQPLFSARSTKQRNYSIIYLIRPTTHTDLYFTVFHISETPSTQPSSIPTCLTSLKLCRLFNSHNIQLFPSQQSNQHTDFPSSQQTYIYPVNAARAPALQTTANLRVAAQCSHTSMKPLNGCQYMCLD